MICPVCDHKDNLPGADWCGRCRFDLSAVDVPTPADRVERSLMADPVTAVGLRPPATVPVSGDLDAAMAAMMSRGVGAVLVVDAAGRLAGILTERDFLTKLADRPGFGGEPVSRWMTRHPEAVGPSDTIGAALGKMAGGGYRHLPVVAAGVPVGVLSVRDVIRHVVGLCRENSPAAP
jgi:CBS domain-containing protein